MFKAILRPFKNSLDNVSGVNAGSETKKDPTSLGNVSFESIAKEKAKRHKALMLEAVREQEIGRVLKEALLYAMWRTIQFFIAHGLPAVKIFLIILVIVVLFFSISMIIQASLGLFGSFKGAINIDFEAFQELNADESIYMDAQNTNGLREAYYKLVSETSYYQMFNIRDLNPDTMHPFLKTMQKLINSIGLIRIEDDDLTLLNMPRSLLGMLTVDERYIYTDANKNVLKHMKLPKVIGIDDDIADLQSALNKVNDNFRDYYNREQTFQLSSTLLSEMNRILFDEFSNTESITYPEAFVKPVAFVNDYYRILDEGLEDKVGLPYVYNTQRVTLSDIKNSSSDYYNKYYLEGMIKSSPSHIVYDYAVELKNIIYWNDTDNDLAKQITWGNVSRYITKIDTEVLMDGTEIEKENAVKLYWKVKDSTKGDATVSDINGHSGVNPYNEHMGATINNKNYKDYFDGPYASISVSGTTVTLSDRLCEGDRAFDTISFEDGGSAKIRCEYNRFPMRHMQLVPVFDDDGYIQLNSRVLFNKSFVQKKSVRDSYRYFPEYFSGFTNFAKADLERMPPGNWADIAGEVITGNEATCTEADFLEDLDKPWEQRKCSIIRRYTGTHGIAYVQAKFQDWFNGENSNIDISAEAMYHILLAYDQYIINTGEFGVAWDYKYYTASTLDMAFAKAQYMDIYGWREVFVDSWNDTLVYKNTLDTVKKLDSANTISTTYVPTAIISGQTTFESKMRTTLFPSETANPNINNSGYGWKIAEIGSDYSSAKLERVKGEASLELPSYSHGNIIADLANFITNATYYGDSNFRYFWDPNGKLVEREETNIKSLVDGFASATTITDVLQEANDALQYLYEGGDYRNTTEAWDPDFQVYAPAKSSTINSQITSTINKRGSLDGLGTQNGRVSYKTHKGDYLPFEVKSVRDYGLGSVLSYIQDVRVVYQAGLFMNEEYSEQGFKDAFQVVYDEGAPADAFSGAEYGYYPKEILDAHAEILSAMKVTPIPMEDLTSLASNIISLQYGATLEEMDLAAEKAGDSATEKQIREELLKIISGRNVEGIYVNDPKPAAHGGTAFPLTKEPSGITKNPIDICRNCADECGTSNSSSIPNITDPDADTDADTDADSEEDTNKECLRQCKADGGYWNEYLDDCNSRCERDAEVSIAGLHPSLSEKEMDDEKAKIERKKTNCLNMCKTSYPERGGKCNNLGLGAVDGIYAYSPVLTDSYLSEVIEFLFGWLVDSAKTYTRVQYYDPLQYYVSWIDWSYEEESDILNKMLHWVEGGKLITEIQTNANTYLEGVENQDKGFDGINIAAFNKNGAADVLGTVKAGSKISSDFKSEFYNKYKSALKPINLIIENETYRVYMIDEAVTFIGTFTYTYKTEINNISVANDAHDQVISMAYADRYYYLSNYMIKVPLIEFVPELYDTVTSEDGCDDDDAMAHAEAYYNSKKWYNPLTWFQDKIEILDADKRCSSETSTASVYVCPEEGEEGECGYQNVTSTGYVTEYWASVPKTYTNSASMPYFIMASPTQLNYVMNQLSGSDKEAIEKLYIGAKVYASLSAWAWSLQTGNSTDFNATVVYDYEPQYSSGEYFVVSDSQATSANSGTTEGTIRVSFVGIEHPNLFTAIGIGSSNTMEQALSGRKGFFVESPWEVDGNGYPDDLHMSVNNYVDAKDIWDERQITAKDLNDILRILLTTNDSNTGKPFIEDTTKEEVIPDTDGEIRLKIGTKPPDMPTDDTNSNVAIAILASNREKYGYPIPLMRHYSGVTREILPRQLGYYFEGEVYDSWHTRIVLTEDTTPVEKDMIVNEKNQLESYFYDYIMNFETYVPYNVKSDYDLMSRAREAYHVGVSNETSHTTTTSVLSNSIYNIVNTEPWKETINQFNSPEADVKLDATTVSQLISGIIETQTERAPKYMINVLNQQISDPNRKILDNSSNQNIIKNAVTASVNGNVQSTISWETDSPASESKMDVELELKDGTKQKFRLTNLGPGMVFYDYNNSGAGTISTSSVAPGQTTGGNYTKSFDDVSLSIGDSSDDRMDKTKSIEFVSVKFGKLLRKYGYVKLAILAYFYGETYVDNMQAAATETGTTVDWLTTDDTNLIAKALQKSGLSVDAGGINTFMYTATVVSKTMSYIQDTAAKTALNNAATIPASANGVSIGTKADTAKSVVWEKWDWLISKWAATYDVDAALITAIFMQESSGNSFAGMCGSDGVTAVNKNRTCSNLHLNYNGGGGLGQIHATCDTSGKNVCYRPLTASNGDQCSVAIANPQAYLTTSSGTAAIDAYLAIDERFGDVDKNVQWATIYLSNLLNTYDGDAYKVLVSYNGAVGYYNAKSNPTGWKFSDPDWFEKYQAAHQRWWTNKYSSPYSGTYVDHVMRYYDESIATGSLTYSSGGSAAKAFDTGFGLATGDIAYKRDLFAIQNSGVEFYKPRLTTARKDVTTLILNVSNFGREEYYMYANEEDVLSFFNRDPIEEKNTNNGKTTWLGGAAVIIEEGIKTNLEVPSGYKFVWVTPIIPMLSPDGGSVEGLKINQQFGIISQPSGDMMHDGVDFDMALGSKVFPVATGRVTVAKNNDSSYGNMIEISHVVPEDTIIVDQTGHRYQVVGIFTRYSNLSEIYVKEGDVISLSCSSADESTGASCNSISTAMGTVGTTEGKSQLHFEVLLSVKDLSTGQLLPATRENSMCDAYYWLSTKWSSPVFAVEDTYGTNDWIDDLMSVIKEQYPDLSYQRETLIRNGLILVGNVPYQWGGGHAAKPYLGINPAWGHDLVTIGVGGHSTSGTQQYAGLDCSGFTRWAIFNTTHDDAYSAWSTVTGQWKITSDNASQNIKLADNNLLPGDFAVYDGLTHVGIYLYTDSAGKKVYLHSSSGYHSIWGGQFYSPYNGIESGVMVTHASFLRWFTPIGIDDSAGGGAPSGGGTSSGGTVSGSVYGSTGSKEYLMVGDSHMEGFKYDSKSNAEYIDVRGISTNGMKSEISRAKSLSFKKVLIELGTNDAAGGVNEANFKNNYKSIIQSIRSYNPNATIYIMSAPPVRSHSSVSMDRIQTVNSWIRSVASSEGVDFIDGYGYLMGLGLTDSDYARDGTHLNASTYKKWQNWAISQMN